VVAVGDKSTLGAAFYSRYHFRCYMREGIISNILFILADVFTDGSFLGRDEVQGSGENFIMKSLMICTPHPILCG
jgi:hypothetical protein